MTLRTDPVDGKPDLPEFLCGAAEDNVPRPRPTMARSGTAGHVPGEIGIWIFVLGDMTVFAALLAMLLWERRSQPALVAESAAHLMPTMGFINTLTLLVSSYLVVYAIHAHRRDAHREARRFVAAAIGCAAVFATVKAIEYTREIGAGFTPTTDIFFNYYFALTGLHLLHVLIGVTLLTWWWIMTKRGRTWLSSQVAVEGVAVYWHMVDLLWIAIFTLAYLVSPQ
jgi:nitric oxide reductase NorE protein